MNFSAGLRFRRPELVLRAVRSKLELCDDPIWQKLEFLQPVVHSINGSMESITQIIIDTIRSLAPYVSPVYPASELSARSRLVAAMSCLQHVRLALNSEIPEETKAREARDRAELTAQAASARNQAERTEAEVGEYASATATAVGILGIMVCLFVAFQTDDSGFHGVGTAIIVSLIATAVAAGAASAIALSKISRMKEAGVEYHRAQGSKSAATASYLAAKKRREELIDQVNAKIEWGSHASMAIPNGFS